jgi:hypothetical protein
MLGCEWLPCAVVTVAQLEQAEACLTAALQQAAAHQPAADASSHAVQQTTAQQAAPPPTKPPTRPSPAKTASIAASVVTAGDQHGEQAGDAAPTADREQAGGSEQEAGLDLSLDTLAESEDVDEDVVPTELPMPRRRSSARQAQHFAPITARRTSASTAHLEKQLADFATFNGSGKCAVTARSSEATGPDVFASTHDEAAATQSSSNRRLSAGMGGTDKPPSARRLSDNGRSGSFVTGAGRLSITEQTNEHGDTAAEDGGDAGQGGGDDGRGGGDDERGTAKTAARVQALFRGKSGRWKAKRVRELHDSAVDWETLLAEEDAEAVAATRLQAAIRGRHVRREGSRAHPAP